MTSVLEKILADRKTLDARANEVDVRGGLGEAACRQIQRLVRETRATTTLEIGMAMGVSTLAFLETLPPGSSHIAIDPNQSSDHEEGWHGIGIANVERANFQGTFRLYEEPSYAVLPRLLSEERRFDVIFIDGCHAFDFAFIDYFYADLLLREDGILVFDDWGMPPVYHVIRFLEAHKAYQRLGPADLPDPMSLRQKYMHRAGRFDDWGSVCAFRKLKSVRARGDFYHSTFYPKYWLYRWWVKLRGHRVPAPYLTTWNGPPQP